LYGELLGVDFDVVVIGVVGVVGVVVFKIGVVEWVVECVVFKVVC